MSENNLTCKIVTPEKVVFQGVAKMVVVPAYDGELGILKGHARLVASLSCGECRVVSEKTNIFYVEGGIVKVASQEGKTEVVLLVESGCTIAQLKDAKDFFSDELKRSRELDASDDESFKRRQRAIKAARKKLELAEKAS